MDRILEHSIAAVPLIKQLINMSIFLNLANTFVAHAFLFAPCLCFVFLLWTELWEVLTLSLNKLYRLSDAPLLVFLFALNAALCLTLSLHISGCCSHSTPLSYFSTSLVVLVWSPVEPTERNRFSPGGKSTSLLVIAREGKRGSLLWITSWHPNCCV